MSVVTFLGLPEAAAISYKSLVVAEGKGCISVLPTCMGDCAALTSGVHKGQKGFQTSWY